MEAKDWLRATLDEHWFSEDLAGCLVDANLGYLKYETEPPFDPFLRTSARIAQIYNSRLAEIVASRLGFSLTGVDHGPFPGSAHWGPETVREVLTTGTFVGDVQLHESTGVAGLALVSIQAVLPGDLKAMTIRQVADFRARNRLALTTFQDFIERIVTSSALPEVLSSPSDARAVVLQLQNEYERSVAPALRSLERSLQKIGVGAVWRALSLNTAAPLLVAGGLNSILPDGALSQVIVSSAGLALAAGRLVYDARSERTEQALANPVGYLLALQRRIGVMAFTGIRSRGPGRPLLGICSLHARLCQRERLSTPLRSNDSAARLNEYRFVSVDHRGMVWLGDDASPDSLCKDVRRRRGRRLTRNGRRGVLL